MATEADLIQKFKDLNIPVGADFEELIHAAFAGTNLADIVNSYDSRIATVEDNLDTTKGSIQANTNQLATKADDSKVAHLSGSNNFDTVPTVKNNPLLLASSLPSDLARTGSDQEFTGKNTFDIAPIDKTTGNPYITKSGVPAVPSTLADTTKDTNFTGKLQKSGIDVATKSDVTTAVSTATANMVDSTKATNFTAGLKSGGIDVATAADLKSIEDSAWHQLDNKYITSDIGISPASTVLYKIDDTNKRLYLQGSVMLSSRDTYAITLHLDSIVNRVLTVTGIYFGYNGDDHQNWTNIRADSSLIFYPQNGLVQFSVDNYYHPWESKGPLYITYDKLV